LRIAAAQGRFLTSRGHFMTACVYLHTLKLHPVEYLEINAITYPEGLSIWENGRPRRSETR
ncbi:MAG: hypothetical protein V3V34_09305, partial [Kiloniellales bacterium]